MQAEAAASFRLHMSITPAALRASQRLAAHAVSIAWSLHSSARPQQVNSTENSAAAATCKHGCLFSRPEGCYL